MSKSKCWIKTNYVPVVSDYIRAGKWYEVELCDNLKGGIFLSEDGEMSFTSLEDSAHINGDWQVYYGDVPPDFVGEPTINDKGLGDGELAHKASLPVNEVQDITEEVIQVLDRTSNDSISDGMETQDFIKLLDKLKSGEYSVICNTNIN